MQLLFHNEIKTNGSKKMELCYVTWWYLRAWLLLWRTLNIQGKGGTVLHSSGWCWAEVKPAGCAGRGRWVSAVGPFPGTEASDKGPADSVSCLQEPECSEVWTGVLKYLRHTLTAPLHLAMFAAYRPKPEPSDTEEVFPLRFRGLSKYLLISVP